MKLLGLGTIISGPEADGFFLGHSWARPGGFKGKAGARATCGPANVMFGPVPWSWQSALGARSLSLSPSLAGRGGLGEQSLGTSALRALLLLGHLPLSRSGG